MVPEARNCIPSNQISLNSGAYIAAARYQRSSRNESIFVRFLSFRISIATKLFDGHINMRAYLPRTRVVPRGKINGVDALSSCHCVHGVNLRHIIDLVSEIMCPANESNLRRHQTNHQYLSFRF